MIKRLFASLYFKISFLVILVEAGVFLILGNFYTTLFSQKIDENIISAVSVPGILMSQGQLNYSAVRDPDSIAKLLRGEQILDAMVFDIYGKIIWAIDRVYENLDIYDIVEKDELPSFNEETRDVQNVWQVTGKSRHLLNLSPIFYQDEGEERLIGFLYLKVKVVEAGIEKQANVFLFTISAFIGIIITSMGIAFFSIRHFIFNPLEKLIKNVNLIGRGKIDALIDIKTNDEIELLAEAVKKMARQIEQSDKLKDDFLANTSHELRTPLNGIIGLAESLLDGVAGEMNDTVKANLKLIISSGIRLSGLVNDILDFSRIKNQDIRLERKAVDIKQIIELVLTLSRPLAYKKELKLKSEISPNIPMAYADENRLQQILYNLIGNAVKFTPRGQIYVSAAEKEGMLLVLVSDTGIGISREHRKDIFKTFYQLDSSSSRHYPGTGLGLSIVKYLVELHGGEVWVESEEYVGSDFYFTIPLSRENEPRNSCAMEPLYRQLEDIPEKLEVHGFAPRGSSILVVDDEHINLQLLANHLLLNDYKVLYALSGDEALAILKEQEVDAVLLDVMMPRMNGFEVCRIIRKTFTPNQLPVLMITAKNQVSDLTEGMEAGANDYITKPVAKSELLARLKTHLQIKTLSQEIVDTQKEIILRVGAIAESRSKETGNHVKRVAEYSYLLAVKYGLPDDECNLIKYAAPMHDIGKVAIPDSILNKPEGLTPEEREYMSRHTTLGYEMIGKSERPLMKTAAIIALTHHEKWDGTGYPRGLVGEEIPLAGRIVAIADVFDALGSDRCYKTAWTQEAVLNFFHEEKGKQFEPRLVDLFFENIQEIMGIKEKFSDISFEF